MLRLACFLLLVSTLAAAAAPSDVEQRFRAEVAAVSPEAAAAYDRATAAGEAAKWDEALVHYRRVAELAPKIDHPHRRMCSVLANLGRTDEALAECEIARTLNSASPYNKMALAYAIAQTKRDLARALALANEAIPELSADPVALGIYCAVLIDARTLPGVDGQLNACIAHLYVLDPEGMESNYLGAIVAALHGQRELARQRLDVAKKAGLPDAEYAQLAAEIDGRGKSQPVSPTSAAPPTHNTMSTVLAFAAGAIGTAVLLLIGVRLSRRRRS